MVAALLFSASQALATTYWVADDGSDSNSCTQTAGSTDPGTYKRNAHGPSGALSCMVPGDTLHFKGRVTGVQLAPNSVVNGVSPALPTIIEGDGVDVTTLVLSSSAIVLTEPKDLVIRRLTVDGNERAHGAQVPCLQLTGTTGERVLLEDVSVHHCATHGIRVGPLVRDVTLRRVQAAFNGDQDQCRADAGVDHSGAAISGDDVRVEQSWFHDNGCSSKGYGLLVYSSGPDSDGRADRFVLRDSIVERSGGLGILVEGREAVLQGNVIARNAIGGLVLGYSNGSERGLVANNTLFSNGPFGIIVGQFGPADDTALFNNLVLGQPSAIRVVADFTDAGSIIQRANVVTGPLTDCTSSLNDFRQKPGSTCTDMGVPVPGNEQVDPRDVGAFEIIKLVAGTVSGNEVTLTFSPEPAIEPGSTEGWALDNGRTVVEVRHTDESVVLVFDGAPCATETWAVSYDDALGSARDATPVGGPQYGVLGSQRLYSFGPTPLTNACHAELQRLRSPLACGVGGASLSIVSLVLVAARRRRLTRRTW